MVLELSYSFPGDTKEQFRLGFTRYAHLFEKPFRGIARDLKDWFDEIEESQFASQGVRGGDGWDGWALSTAEGYKGYANELMVASGAMKKALTKSNSKGALRKVEDARAELGIDFFGSFKGLYPIYHQAGSEKTNLPQRRIVAMTQADAFELVKIVQANLAKQARKEAKKKGDELGGVK